MAWDPRPLSWVPTTLKAVTAPGWTGNQPPRTSTELPSTIRVLQALQQAHTQLLPALPFSRFQAMAEGTWDHGHLEAAVVYLEASEGWVTRADEDDGEAKRERCMGA